eukprot:symbB.v1.2.031329.t1/scaffold3620.1/size53174/5
MHLLLVFELLKWGQDPNGSEAPENKVPHRTESLHVDEWRNYRVRLGPCFHEMMPMDLNDVFSRQDQVLVNSHIKDASVAIRKGFVQKVYGILVMQLALTVVIAAQIVLFASASGDVSAWITRNEWLLWLSVFGTFSVMRYPANYIVLFTFTAFEAILIGLVSTMFTPQSLLLAAGVTTLIFLALTLYAMQASTDFTGSGPYLFAGLLVLFIFGLILGILPLIGVPIAISTAIYDCLGVLVFSFAVIFDTQPLGRAECSCLENGEDTRCSFALMTTSLLL